jgi:uncharacterized protein YjiS (DUF1127 family)
MPIALHHPMINSHSARPSAVARVRAVADKLSRTLRVWRSRIRERQAFPVVDDRDLRDLGLSRWEVDRELAKPFWRG